mmetsp:Transcript_11291/g.14870  ORF Transcript_11291/g.14870 Transcript_11291/m.14870 type:complete len:168 (+) Transcript_11291:208-711(+)
MLFTAFRSLAFPTITKQHVERRLLRGVPAHHLFQIIQDVDRYKSFLPLCSHSQIISRLSPNEFRATLTVGFVPPLSDTYTSHVTVNPTALTIQTKSIESKWLDSLQSMWKLEAANDGQDCHVDFSMSLTTSDPIILQTLDQVMKQVANQQVTAFETRCRQIPVVKYN